MKSYQTVAIMFFLIGITVMAPVKAQYVNPNRTPADIRAAYDVNPLIQSGYTGKGVTVAIIGESIGPTFNSDVRMYSEYGHYGLPPPNISVVQPFGPGGDSSSWEEIAADTEFVHAMAPDAKILLVLVGAHDTSDGFSYVIDHNAADIATMSFSQCYCDNGEGWDLRKAQSYNDEYAKSVNEKITLISTSGDSGSNNTVPWTKHEDISISNFWTKYLPDAYLMPQYSPYVTIVGGTEFTTYSGPGPEIGWSQSGGGPSNLFPEPNWQIGQGVPQNHRRNIPDVALDASCDTPYAKYFDAAPGWFCGTSAAAPTFAGIIADIDQAAGGRIGFLNPTLYALAASDPSVYHDITSGCSLVQVGSSTETGYCAHPGWDFVTGWGSIDAAKLAKHLAPTAQMVTTTSTSLSTSSLMSTASVATAAYINLASLSTLALQNPALTWSGTIILGVAVVVAAAVVAILALRKRGSKR